MNDQAYGDDNNHEPGYSTIDENISSSATAFHEPQDVHRLVQMFQGVVDDMPSDFDSLMQNKPDWIDPEKLKRGQQFALEHYFGVSFSKILSLYILFALSHNGLDTLIYTRMSDTPYKAYRRYYATSDIIKSWMETDILTPETKGNKNMRRVFQMHQKVHEDLLQNPIIDGQMEPRCTILGKPWYTATLANLKKDFKCISPAPTEINSLLERQKTVFNQCYLTTTQFGFFGLAIVYPEWFGIHDYSRQDMEDFVHLWRTIGYLMGIKDEYNFGRGTLDEVKERSKWLIRVLVIPKFREITEKWEHMSRCAAEGVRMYMKKSLSFESSFCYLCDILGLKSTNVKKTIGFRKYIYLWWLRFFMKYLLKWNLFNLRKRLNRYIFKSMKTAAEELNNENIQIKLLNKFIKYEQTAAV
ncbi:Domain of unknown function DUF2236 [Cinara cedri]|uniref:Uncharacterized protein n=1 Tax=Cinara cedri TaxID=506608 RepID=A0A5E4MRI4_9HEMI|nr:Domain of unknown function DUF2236 [Cinara cedri]